MAKLYSISLLTQPLIGTHPAVIDSKLTTLGNWIRFSTHQWFIWTERSKANLYDEIAASIVNGDQFIVVSVAPHFAQGRAPQWIWEWLNDKMNQEMRN